MTGSRSATRKAAFLSEPAASAGTLASRLFPRGEAIEALKWLGLAAMLVEHWMRYVAGDLPAWAYAVGRLAFPLFIFALAVGRSGIRIPRARRAFYWIYTLQFPMFAAIRMLGS